MRQSITHRRVFKIVLVPTRNLAKGRVAHLQAAILVHKHKTGLQRGVHAVEHDLLLADKRVQVLEMLGRGPVRTADQRSPDKCQQQRRAKTAKNAQAVNLLGLPFHHSINHAGGGFQGNKPAKICQITAKRIGLVAAHKRCPALKDKAVFQRQALHGLQRNLAIAQQHGLCAVGPGLQNTGQKSTVLLLPQGKKCRQHPVHGHGGKQHGNRSICTAPQHFVHGVGKIYHHIAAKGAHRTKNNGLLLNGASHKGNLGIPQGGIAHVFHKGVTLGRNNPGRNPALAAAKILQQILHIAHLLCQIAQRFIAGIHGIWCGKTRLPAGAKVVHIHRKKAEHFGTAHKPRLLHHRGIPHADGLQRFINPCLLHFALVIQNILRDVLELQGAKAVGNGGGHHQQRKAHRRHCRLFKTVASGNGLFAKILRFHGHILLYFAIGSTVGGN